MMPRVVVSCLIALSLLIPLGPVRADDSAPLLARLVGPISPASAQYLVRVIDRAADDKAAAVIIALDTPGGLAESMRTMVQAILNSPVPIIVYVSPQGARAASAGLMICLAAHVAAMAPGTNIGAASVVSAGGKDVGGTMGKKVTNDMVAFVRSLAIKRGRNADWAEKAVRYAHSLPAVEAAAEGVIDLVAPDLPALLAWVDGRRVETPAGMKTIRLAGLKPVTIEPSFRDRVLGFLANPSLAYLLLMLGMLGLYLELSHPGAILPGVVGAASLIIAFFAMQTLSVSVAGLLLLLLGVVLFILELKITSYGLLSIGGVVCLFLGSIMLFEDFSGAPAVALSVIIPTVGVVSLFFIGVVFLVWRSQRSRVATGREGLIGLTGPVLTWSGQAGTIRIHGEIWQARSDDPLAPGDPVEVTEASGLNLTVRPITGA